MLSTLPQPLEIKEVGENASALVGPIVIAATALLGAMLTAYTANRRHQHQLEHDSERQRAQLEHDSERQQEQLAHDSRRHEEQLEHDRDMRRRDHVYDTLDSVVDGTARALRMSIRFASTVFAREANRDKYLATRDSADATPAEKEFAEKRIQAIEKEFWDCDDASHEAIMDMGHDTWRLRVRFGMGGRVPRRHNELRKALREVHQTLTLALAKSRDEAQKQATEPAIKARNAASRRFFAACEEWFHENP